MEAAPGDCPAFDDETQRVVCTGAVSEDAPMYLEPSATSVALPESLSFTLSNGTDVEFETNFYAWTLLKRVEGRWHRVAPTIWPQPVMTLSPGGEHTWTVRMDGDGDNEGEPIPRSQGTEDVTVDALGGGRYAFAVEGWFPSEGHERKTAFAAAFDVEGAPLELTTTRYVEDVTVEGDVLRARWTLHEDGEEAIYVLARTEVENAEPLIPEQAVRRRAGREPLRDALALAVEHDIHEVRLRGPTNATPPFGAHGRTFAYRGTTYRIDVEEAD